MKEPENLCISCDNSKNATKLFEIFKRKGYIWSDYNPIEVDHTYWERYRADTLYLLNKGKIKYGNNDCYEYTQITATQYILRYGDSHFSSVYHFFKGIFLPFEEGGMSSFVKESLFDTTDYKEIMTLMDETELEEKYEEYLDKYFLIPGDVIEISGGKTRGIVLEHGQLGYTILWRSMKTSGLLDDDEFKKVEHIDITGIVDILNDRL